MAVDAVACRTRIIKSIQPKPIKINLYSWRMFVRICTHHCHCQQSNSVAFPLLARLYLAPNANRVFLDFSLLIWWQMARVSRKPKWKHDAQRSQRKKRRVRNENIICFDLNYAHKLSANKRYTTNGRWETHCYPCPITHVRHSRISRRADHCGRLYKCISANRLQLLFGDESVPRCCVWAVRHAKISSEARRTGVCARI